MAKSTTETKPNKTFTQVTQKGLKAYNLAAQYKAELGTRLDPAVPNNLSTDLASLGVIVPAAKTAAGAATAATATQNSALETGYESVSAVRKAVQRLAKDAAVKKGYGVGTKVNAHVVKDVKDALQTITNRASAQPAEAASFGITAADVATYKDQLDAITKADAAQEQARAAAPQTTKQRNATARRILASVDVIAAAGLIAFANSKTEREKFDALIRNGA
jgi:hypothetical protein